MERIIDKGILLLLGILLTGGADTAAPVVAMLLGMIAGALGIFVLDLRRRSIYMILFLAGCFFLPELCFFLPMIFYDCTASRRTWLFYGSVPLYVLYYIKTGGMEAWTLGIWLVSLVLSVLLGARTERLETLENDMIRLRDTSTELNLVLREKNKNLMEKQDYEIHLATLRERNRIAREIHDNVGHMLSRSILQMGALETIYKQEPLHEQLGSVNETLNQAMNSIRESVHDLHDDSIDLRQAILDATRDMKERYHVRIDYDMSVEVPRSVKYCFITTVKEAMSNIVKHSDADRVTVMLREHPGFYQLTVEDNGKAPKGAEEVAWQKQQMAETGQGGIGLSNMKERVEALHGTFRIHRESGFSIFISIPKEQRT